MKAEVAQNLRAEPVTQTDIFEPDQALCPDFQVRNVPAFPFANLEFERTLMCRFPKFALHATTQ